MSLLFILGVWAYLGWVIQKGLLGFQRGVIVVRSDQLGLPA